MHDALADARLLKLAESRETAFAMLLVDLSTSALRSARALAQAHDLLRAAEGQRREVGRQLQRLGGLAGARRVDEVEAAALLDLVETARSDRRGLRELAARVRDAEAAGLLVRLAGAKEGQAGALETLIPPAAWRMRRGLAALRAFPESSARTTRPAWAQG